MTALFRTRPNGAESGARARVALTNATLENHARYRCASRSSSRLTLLSPSSGWRVCTLRAEAAARVVACPLQGVPRRQVGCALAWLVRAHPPYKPQAKRRLFRVKSSPPCGGGAVDRKARDRDPLGVTPLRAAVTITRASASGDCRAVRSLNGCVVGCPPPWPPVIDGSRSSATAFSRVTEATARRSQAR